MNFVLRHMDLTDEQTAQVADLAHRLLNMATLGVPRVDSTDPGAPQLLALDALATAFQALATANPACIGAAAYMAAGLREQLSIVAQRHANHNHPG